MILFLTLSLDSLAQLAAKGKATTVQCSSRLLLLHGREHGNFEVHLVGVTAG